MSVHEEEALGKAYDARLMRRLLTYLWPYRPSGQYEAIKSSAKNLKT